MALNLDLGPSPLSRVLDAVAATPAHAWLLDIGVAVGGILIGWIVGRVICKSIGPSKRWTFGKGEFAKVVAPFVAFLFVWGGKHVLGNFQDVDVLEILDSALLAFAAIRLAAYILGHVIPEGGLQRFTIRAVYALAIVTVLLYVTGLLPDVLGWLDAHGFQLGKDKHEVTLLDLVKGVLATFLAVVLALWISRVSEGRVMAAVSLEQTTRIVIAKVIRIAALMLAIFIGLPMAGIDLTTLSILTGAVGVGLGFGMQKIASNYVSGFIILLEHSLRIGDVVTVDGRKGEVKAIQTRYTLIKGSDGVESMIPNEKLIGETVNHHTYSDPKVSVVIGVTVAYDSDIEKARALMLEAAERHRNVIKEPASIARVKQLSDRGVELETTVWIEDPKLSDADIRSELLVEILRDFRAAKIEIPYPHREVRLSATPEMQNSRAPSRT
jgi:small-conductance mechanosensitive channel